MNNTQTQQDVGGINLSQTQNPQTIPAQSLGAPESTLQASTSTLLSQTGLKITSVGSSQFKPVTSPAATTSTVPLATDNFSIVPLTIGAGAVLIILATLVILAIKKGTPQPSA